MIVNASSNRLIRWSNGKPNARYSVSFQPAPRPRISRPPLISSTVAAFLASIAGAWKLVEATSGPSLTRDVAAASAASIVQHSHGPRGSRFAGQPIEEVIADPDRVEPERLGAPGKRDVLRPADLALDLGELDADLEWAAHLESLADPGRSDADYHPAADGLRTSERCRPTIGRGTVRRRPPGGHRHADPRRRRRWCRQRVRPDRRPALVLRADRHRRLRRRPGRGRRGQGRGPAVRRGQGRRLEAPTTSPPSCREHGISHVLNAVDPRFVMPIFDGAFAAGADYLDMAMSLSQPHPDQPYELTGEKLGDAQFAKAGAWEAAGRLALVGIGVEPGLSDVFARYAADHLFSEIDELGVRDGANLVVEGYDFAPSFSIWTTIEECLNPPVDLGGGSRLVHDAAVQRARGVRVPRGHRPGRVRQRRARGGPPHAALGEGQAGDVQVRPRRRVHQRPAGPPPGRARSDGEGPRRRRRGVAARRRRRLPARPGDARRPDDRQDLRRPVGDRHRHRTARRARSTSITSSTTTGRCASTARRRSSGRRRSTRSSRSSCSRRGPGRAAGVLGPEAFDARAVPRPADGLRLAVGHGRPDRDAERQPSSSRFGASQRAVGLEVRALAGGVLLELIAADPAEPEVGRFGTPEVEPADRRGREHRVRLGQRDPDAFVGARAARTACPSRCGRGRRGSRVPAGCPGSARR